MDRYEHVRSIAADLAGDRAAAERVELVLPETGVCGGAGVFDDPAQHQSGGCCGPAAAALEAAPEMLTLSAPARQ